MRQRIHAPSAMRSIVGPRIVASQTDESWRVVSSSIGVGKTERRRVAESPSDAVGIGVSATGE